MMGKILTIKFGQGLKIITILLCFVIYPGKAIYSQIQISFNALADVAISRAGEKSHYYYNGIDENHVDYRIGFSQLNLMTEMKFNENWSLKSRLLMERDKGRSFNSFTVPQLNLQWLSKTRKLGITLGLFTNPFGTYNLKQLSTKKSIIGHPLAYSYYVNISSKIGYLAGMGDLAKVTADNEVQWGSSNLYYGGYNYGAMLSWNIEALNANWKIAIVNGSPNNMTPLSKPGNLAINSRFKVQPFYFWEQGFSLSYGTFMEESEVNEELVNLWEYSQSLFGTDYKLGYGFLELSGEIIWANYKVPQYDAQTATFIKGLNNDALILSALSAYLDIKYEFPILPGTYAAYRIDHLRFFGQDDVHNIKWDNNVLRHSFAIGYHINQYFLARAGFSTQHVETKKAWEKKQRTFHLILTAHY